MIVNCPSNTDVKYTFIKMACHVQRLALKIKVCYIYFFFSYLTILYRRVPYTVTPVFKYAYRENTQNGL